MYAMRMLNLHVLLVVVFSFFVLCPAPISERYNGVLTRVIYDQSEILRDFEPAVRTGELTQEDLDIALVELLFQNKRMQIFQMVGDGIRIKVETLLQEKSRQGKEKMIEGFQGIGVGILSIVAQIFIVPIKYLSVLGSLGDVVLAGRNVVTGYAATCASSSAAADRPAVANAAVDHLNRSSSPGARILGTEIARIIARVDLDQSIIDDAFAKAKELEIYSLALTDMNLEYAQLIKGIKTELWHKYEEIYVKKRRFLGTDLQESFENKFISARAVGGLGTEQYLSFFGRALDVSTMKKRIGGEVDPDLEVRRLLYQFDQDEELRGYSPEVQHELKKLLITAFYCSRLPDTQEDDRPYIRRAVYAYGAPGSGKTSASKAIPKLLGLPFCEKTVFDISDLSGPSLLGDVLWGQKAGPGWLADAMISTNTQERKSFKNAFLILNDFDRVLMGEGSSTVVTLLLYLLDPDTRKTKNPFFDGQLDIGNLFITLNGNRQLVAAPQAAGGQQAAAAAQPAQAEQPFDAFGALARRLKPIEFAQFPREQRRGIFEKQVRRLVSLFAMPNIDEAVRAATVEDALELPELSEGLVRLGEQYTDYKLMRLTGGHA